MKISSALSFITQTRLYKYLVCDQWYEHSIKVTYAFFALIMAGIAAEEYVRRNADWVMGSVVLIFIGSLVGAFIAGFLIRFGSGCLVLFGDWVYKIWHRVEDKISGKKTNATISIAAADLPDRDVICNAAPATISEHDEILQNIKAYTSIVLSPLMNESDRQRIIGNFMLVLDKRESEATPLMPVNKIEDEFKGLTQQDLCAYTWNIANHAGMKMDKAAHFARVTFLPVLKENKEDTIRKKLHKDGPKIKLQNQILFTIKGISPDAKE